MSRPKWQVCVTQAQGLPRAGAQKRSESFTHRCPSLLTLRPPEFFCFLFCPHAKHRRCLLIPGPLLQSVFTLQTDGVKLC